MLIKLLRSFLAPIFVLLVVSSNAFGTTFNYQISGTGSGSIGASNFTNQAFEINLIGDTNNFTSMGSLAIIDALTSAQVSVAGIGVTTLNIPTRLGLFGGDTVFFSRADGGLDLFDFKVNPSVTNLLSTFSVVGTNVFALDQFSNVDSTMGGVNFVSSSNVIFSSTPPVPEPETYGMMIAGLGLMGFVAHRRKKNQV